MSCRAFVILRGALSQGFTAFWSRKKYQKLKLSTYTHTKNVLGKMKALKIAEGEQAVMTDCFQCFVHEPSRILDILSDLFSEIEL